MSKKTLEAELFEEPYRFEFFQAVRLIQKIATDKKPVGGEALPHEEAIRFRSRIAFDFPASEFQEIRKLTDDSSDEERLEMIQNFMAMAGVSGALPVHYTELAFSRLRYRDTTLWAFLDIFTHRVVSLFYRAWAKYRVSIGYENGDGSFTSYLYDFAGLGTKGLRGRLDVDDESLLPYAGLISQKPHSSTSIENIISDYFGLEAKVEPFVGQWLELSRSEWTLAGKANHVLGGRAIIGTRVWDHQSKFRIRLGPLSVSQYLAFLPNGSGYRSLRSILRFLIGDELDYDAQLCLLAKQVPATILTTKAMRRPLLGWTSFLKSQPFVEDDEQLVLQLAG